MKQLEKCLPDGTAFIKGRMYHVSTSITNNLWRQWDNLPEQQTNLLGTFTYLAMHTFGQHWCKV